MTTTNDSSQRVSRIPNDLLDNLHIVRNQHRIEHLLDNRARLAALSVEQFRCNSDDAMNTFELLVQVESTLEELFPDVHNALFSSWAEQDIALQLPEQLNLPCPTCLATRQNMAMLPDSEVRTAA